MPVDASKKGEAFALIDGLKEAMSKIDGWKGSNFVDAGDAMVAVSTFESQEKHDAAADAMGAMMAPFVPLMAGQPDRKLGNVIRSFSSRDISE